MVRGIGTIINIAFILFGGFVGLFFGKYIKDKMRETVTVITGVTVMMMAIGGVVAKMLVVLEGGAETTGAVMMIVSLVIGAVIGELIDLDGAIIRFGHWLQVRSKSEKDTAFVGAFVTASCTVCIGAMAVVGSIEDGIYGDYSVLLAKGILDAIIICIMASARGKGAVFSAIPVAIFQGFITLIAVFAGSFMTTAALDNLSLVGSVLIFCVGVNLTFDRKIRISNLLPAIVVAAVWGFVA